MSEGHEHPHAHDDGHEHWDYMTGPVDEDFIDDLLEAQERAMANGIIHLTAQLEDIQAQHARVVEMRKWRAVERHLIAVGKEADAKEALDGA